MNRTKDFFKGKVGFGANKFHSYIFSGTGIILVLFMINYTDDNFGGAFHSISCGRQPKTEIIIHYLSIGSIIKEVIIHDPLTNTYTYLKC